VEAASSCDGSRSEYRARRRLPPARGSEIPSASSSWPPSPRCFAAFLLLQLSYLFGNAPARIGSGVTFAEYARRGFAELTTVATLCTLLVVLLERWAARGARAPWARLAAVAVILEVEQFGARPCT